MPNRTAPPPMADRRARYEARRKERGAATVQVRLDAAETAALDAAAAVLGSRTAVVRMALKRFLGAGWPRRP